jgi:hypothetical protein
VPVPNATTGIRWAAQSRTISCTSSVTVTRALAERFGDRAVTGQAVREQHASTLTWVPNHTRFMLIRSIDTPP